ncbi:hypothetical protein GGS21DRAFT_493851 [Xylaria nigripes]|nr:hypothetical protein GGS21DRAFT_493851 [Xylaria nigripes]
MRCYSIALLWALTLHTTTSSPTPPLSSNSLLETSKLDPCSGSGAILDQDYYQADCPAELDLLPDGTCEYSKNAFQDGCFSFCQIRTAFHIMQEIPIPNTYCRGPRPCTIPNDATMPISLWSGDRGIENALDRGVSGGFQATRTVPVGPATFNLGENECGYFTFIGTRKTVCGSLTETYADEDQSICRAPTQTTPNYCADTVWVGTDANEAGCFGQSVFVRLDCGTRLPLPLEQQDERYRGKDVAMPPEQLDPILQSWVHTECKIWDHFLWYDWKIKGRGLKDDILGAYGKNLLRDMRDRLSTVTRWTFEYTPNDSEYDWYASGSIDAIDSSVPKWALLDMGANDAGGC